MELLIKKQKLQYPGSHINTFILLLLMSQIFSGNLDAHSLKLTFHSIINMEFQIFYKLLTVIVLTLTSCGVSGCCETCVCLSSLLLNTCKQGP